MMSQENPKVDDALAGFDERKRATLGRLMAGSSFVAPIVASFAMQGLAISPASAVPPAASNTAKIISDARLKTGIARVGTHPIGFGIYRFRYLWSDVEYIGVLAQEVLDSAPHAVTKGSDDFLRVDYHALGMKMERCEPGVPDVAVQVRPQA